MDPRVLYDIRIVKFTNGSVVLACVTKISYRKLRTIKSLQYHWDKPETRSIYKIKILFQKRWVMLFQFHKNLIRSSLGTLRNWLIIYERCITFFIGFPFDKMAMFYRWIKVYTCWCTYALVLARLVYPYGINLTLMPIQLVISTSGVEKQAAFVIISSKQALQIIYMNFFRIRGCPFVIYGQRNDGRVER